MNFSGKEGRQNIPVSAEPGMEPGTLGLEGRDLTTGPTPPLTTHLQVLSVFQDCRHVKFPNLGKHILYVSKYLPRERFSESISRR